MAYKDKIKEKEWSKQYYIKNREKILKRIKKFYIDNIEKKIEYNNQYYINNKDKILEQHKKYRQKNGEQISEAQSKYHKTDKHKLIRKQWNKTEKGKAHNQRGDCKRRIREKLLINTLTADEWVEILKQYKFRCAYCGKEFTLFDRETRDHVIPISKGGDNIKENIVPACRSCNSRKGNNFKKRK